MRDFAPATGEGSWAAAGDTAAIWVRGNHQPIIGNDSAIRERVNIVPFNHEQPMGKRDKTLVEKITKTELSGVLNWALIGMQRYVKRGYEFELPIAVTNATKCMQSQSDVIGLWLDECCDIDATKTDLPYREESKALYHNYKMWCVSNGHKQRSSRGLLTDLRSRFGFPKDPKKWPLRSNGKLLATGFKLNRPKAVEDATEIFINETHKNNQYIAQLLLALTKAGITVPEDNRKESNETVTSDASDQRRAPVIPFNRARRGR